MLDFKRELVCQAMTCFEYVQHPSAQSHGPKRLQPPTNERFPAVSLLALPSHEAQRPLIGLTGQAQSFPSMLVRFAMGWHSNCRICDRANISAVGSRFLSHPPCKWLAKLSDNAQSIIKSIHGCAGYEWGCHEAGPDG